MNPASQHWLNDCLRRNRALLFSLTLAHLSLTAFTLTAGFPFLAMVEAPVGILFLAIELTRNPLRSLLAAPMSADDLAGALWRVAFVGPALLCIVATAAGAAVASAFTRHPLDFGGVAAALLAGCGLLGVNTLCMTQLPSRPPQGFRESLKAFVFSAPWGVQNTFLFIVPVVPAWKWWLVGVGILGLGAGLAARKVLPCMVVDRARPASAGPGSQGLAHKPAFSHGPRGWAAMRPDFFRQLAVAAGLALVLAGSARVACDMFGLGASAPRILPALSSLHLQWLAFLAWLQTAAWLSLSARALRLLPMSPSRLAAVLFARALAPVVLALAAARLVAGAALAPAGGMAPYVFVAGLASWMTPLSLGLRPRHAIAAISLLLVISTAFSVASGASYDHPWTAPTGLASLAGSLWVTARLLRSVRGRGERTETPMMSGLF